MKETPEPHPRRNRRALSHVGGRIEQAGSDAAALEAISRALRVRADENATLAHVHGFHSYPARLHPETASRLVEGLSKKGDRVLDPFCGSGTVLVEARRLGRRAVGVDVNPLAIELAWLKTSRIDDDEATALLDVAHQVAASADERRLAKSGPTRRYGEEDLELYDRHVLLELDGLSAGIEKHARGDRRRALLLVLSAILTKVSKKPGDTTAHKVDRRIASGYTIRLFEKKSHELAHRLLDYALLVDPASPRADARVGDARSLRGIGNASVQLIVSSPPYPGVYDYHSHHATRLRWLGLEDGRFDQTEIGARRQARGQSYEKALASWRRDFGACLSEMRRVLAPRGRAALVIADSVLGGRALRADRVVTDLAASVGLTLVARGSQARPHFHAPTAAAFRREPRREHVLVLERG